jgi:hypothetical protein
MQGRRDEECGYTQGRGETERRGVLGPWPTGPARPSSALHLHSSRITLARRDEVSKDLDAVDFWLYCYSNLCENDSRRAIWFCVFSSGFGNARPLEERNNVLSSQFTGEPKP